MKLLFLCVVLFLNYSFADERKYTQTELGPKLKEVCHCPTDVEVKLHKRKRETYQAVESRINEKQVNVDDMNPRRASAYDNNEKERNMIFGNRRKEDGLSFLWKRINKRDVDICCALTVGSCVISSHGILEECLNEGCVDEEIVEVC